MYKCDRCGKHSELGQREIKIVSETREKEYPERFTPDGWGKSRRIDRGGVGTEVVKEERICYKCAVKEDIPIPVWKEGDRPIMKVENPTVDVVQEQ